MGFFRNFFKSNQKRFDIEVGDESILAPSFVFDNRGDPRLIRLIIGENSHIACSVTLERETGKVSIGDRTYIGAGTNIICATDIQIGSDVLMAWGVTIVDHDSHSTRWQDRAEDVERWRLGLLEGGMKRASQMKNWDTISSIPIVIGNKAWIGFNVIILKGVHVGEGAVVAAGSVVTKDVPSFCVVAGNPARVVRELNQDER